MKTTLTIETVDNGIKVTGESLPQRQDALLAQLNDLIPLANKMGCYDAADYLRKCVN